MLRKKFKLTSQPKILVKQTHVNSESNGQEQVKRGLQWRAGNRLLIPIGELEKKPLQRQKNCKGKVSIKIDHAYFSKHDISKLPTAQLLFVIVSSKSELCFIINSWIEEEYQRITLDICEFKLIFKIRKLKKQELRRKILSKILFRWDCSVFTEYKFTDQSHCNWYCFISTSENGICQGSKSRRYEWSERISRRRVPDSTDSKKN